MIKRLRRPLRGKPVNFTRFAAVSAIAAVGLAASAGARSAASASAGCTSAASPASSVRGTGPVRELLSVRSRRSAFQTYDDYILDVETAPDICASDFVTNDNSSITAGMHIHDRDGFRAGDGYRIFFDTDSNPATGGGATGVSVGAEYVIDITANGALLSTWTGSSFVAVTPQPRIPMAWIDGFGPAIKVGLGDLGNPQTFNFVFVTSNAGDLDLAPDTGAWSYRLTPFALTAGPVAVGSARAGKSFVARMAMVRSDFDVALDQGTIACAARVGDTSLAGRGTFARRHVACTWRLPRSARGNQLKGTIAVTFAGANASRAFHVRVT